MTMPQIDTFHLVIAGFLLAVALIIPITRSLLVWLFGVIWEAGRTFAGMLFAFCHEASTKLIEAHKCWLANWRPRQMVIPSLRKEGSTRRIT